MVFVYEDVIFRFWIFIGSWYRVKRVLEDWVFNFGFDICFLLLLYLSLFFIYEVVLRFVL